MFKLIEINGRSGMWMGLPIKCGIDFPWIMYNDLVWNKTLQVSEYKTGVKWIHETSDMLLTILHPRQSKLLSKEYLSTYFAPKTCAVFARDDWKPTVIEWYLIILLALRKLADLCTMFSSKIIRLFWRRPY